MEEPNQFSPLNDQPPERKAKSIGLVELLVAAVFFLTAGAGGYFYYAYHNNSLITKKTSQKETSSNVPTSEPKRYTSTDAIDTIQAATTTEETTQALKTFFKQYDMSFAVKDLNLSDYVNAYAKITEIGFSDLSSYQSLAVQLVDEWAKYPKQWIEASQVEGVVIAKQISVQGQVRSAMPDIDGDIVYYAIDYASDYMAAVIHHEFEHLIEYNLFNRYDNPDEEWTLCNGTDFAYKGGGILAYDDPEYNDDDHPRPGFVSTYATYAIEEDKAELYSYLMTTSKYPNLMQWAKNDACLTRKVSLYKKFMRSYAPEMDDAYFDAIHGL